MGILVSEGTLPSGLPVSNVYMSFGNDVIYVYPMGNNMYSVRGEYKVYKDETKNPGTDIRIQFVVQAADITSGVFAILYEKLKETYPDSTDC